MNISLIKQYHENMPMAQAHDIAITALQRLGLEHIAYKRNPSLNNEERFCVMLLRADGARRNRNYRPAFQDYTAS